MSHRFIHTRVRSVKRRINSTLGFAVNNRLKASTLVQFWKTRKRVNQGKTQCWALFVISKATLTKTAIKPKFFKNFQCYNRSVLYKASEFGVHWKFRINLFKSKRFKDRRCTYEKTGSSHLYIRIYGKRSFPVFSLRLWNSLPFTLNQALLLTFLRKDLRHIFLRKLLSESSINFSDSGLSDDSF